MKQPRDDTPDTTPHHDEAPARVDIPFGVTPDTPVEDLPIAGDPNSRHSYYYDDATNYKVFNPDEDDE